MITLLLDITAGPAGFNMVAAGVWLTVAIGGFVAITETIVRKF